MKTLILLVFLCLIYSCKAPESKKTVDSAALILKKSDSIIKAYDKVQADWSYDTTKDEMTSGSIITASINAVNYFEFKPPYEGYNTASVIIRRKRGNTDVILKIQKGQFIGGIQGTNINVRFDQNRYREYFCSSSNDYDHTVLFINDVGSFIEHLKKAKKLLIEADIYNNGSQQFQFSVGGFKWITPSHKQVKKINGHNYGWIQTKDGLKYVPPPQ